MSGKPPEPSASHGGEATGADDEHRQSDERVGPLALTRHVKDDGRALILYRRVEPERR